MHDGADSIVLARQPIWPTGRMSVLAGFVEAGESLEGTVAREVLEEVGRAGHRCQLPRLPALAVPAVADGRLRGPGRAGRRRCVPRDGEIEEAHWFDRDAVRQMIAAEDPAEADNWAAPPPVAGEPRGSSFEVVLPGPVSIARRMIEGWAGAG